MDESYEYFWGNKKTFKVYILYEESICDLYQKRSTEYEQLVPTSNSIEEWWSTTRNILEKVGNEVLRKKRINIQKISLKILTEGIELEIREKQSAYHKYLQIRTTEDLDIHKDKRNAVEYIIREAHDK